MTFSDRVWKAIRESIDSCNYHATNLIGMLNESNDAVLTTKRIVHNSNIDYGFTKLYECNRLDLTLEAILLEEEWMDLFTEDEKNIARNRLEKVGYHVEWTDGVDGGRSQGNCKCIC